MGAVGWHGPALDLVPRDSCQLGPSNASFCCERTARGFTLREWSVRSATASIVRPHPADCASIEPAVQWNRDGQPSRRAYAWRSPVLDRACPTRLPRRAASTNPEGSRRRRSFGWCPIICAAGRRPKTTASPASMALAARRYADGRQVPRLRRPRPRVRAHLLRPLCTRVPARVLVQVPLVLSELSHQAIGDTVVPHATSSNALMGGRVTHRAWRSSSTWRRASGDVREGTLTATTWPLADVPTTSLHGRGHVRPALDSTAHRTTRRAPGAERSGCDSPSGARPMASATPCRPRAGSAASADALRDEGSSAAVLCSRRGR